MGFDVGGIFKAIGQKVGQIQSWQVGFGEAQAGDAPGSLAKDGVAVSDPAAEQAGNRFGQRVDAALNAIGQAIPQEEPPRQP